MAAPRSLTEFQETCERELGLALAARGSALAGRTLAGESETYIHAFVRDTDVEVYVYENEAQFHQGGKRAGIFEHQDFGTPEQLQAAFIRGVLTTIHAA